MADKTNKIGIIIEGNLVINIDKVKPNDYNPKQDFREDVELSREYEKIKDSLKYYGQIDAIKVRELDDGSYEIVNGYHRWTAMKELGFDKVEIKNYGKVTREEAIKMAVVTEDTRIPLDTLEVAELLKVLKEIGDSMAGLPYTMEEMDKKIALLTFDWGDLEREPVTGSEETEDGDGQLDTIMFKVSITQKENINRKITEVQREQGVTEGRALEIICTSGQIDTIKEKNA